MGFTHCSPGLVPVMSPKVELTTCSVGGDEIGGAGRCAGGGLLIIDWAWGLGSGMA